MRCNVHYTHAGQGRACKGEADLPGRLGNRGGGRARLRHRSHQVLGRRGVPQCASNVPVFFVCKVKPLCLAHAGLIRYVMTSAACLSVLSSLHMWDVVMYRMAEPAYMYDATRMQHATHESSTISACPAFAVPMGPVRGHASSGGEHVTRRGRCQSQAQLHRLLQVRNIRVFRYLVPSVLPRLGEQIGCTSWMCVAIVNTQQHASCLPGTWHAVRECTFVPLGRRGQSQYRGVTRHHQAGRWEARIGRVRGNKYLYLGTFDRRAHKCVRNVSCFGLTTLLAQWHAYLYDQCWRFRAMCMPV